MQAYLQHSDCNTIADIGHSSTSAAISGAQCSIPDEGAVPT